MIKYLSNAFYFVCGSIWSLIIITFYFNRHPEHLEGIIHFKYLPLILISLGIIALLSFLASFNSSKWKSNYVLSGGCILVLILCFSCLMHYSFQNMMGFTMKFNNYLHLIMTLMATIGGTFIVSFISYLLGRLTINIFFTEANDNQLLALAIGFFVQYLVLFALAALGLLSQLAVIIFYLISLIISFKEVIPALRLSVLSGPKLSRSSFFGASFLGLVLVWYFTLNLNHFLGPFPLGFDSRNHYFNIPSLLAQNEGLVSGFSTYSWSIIMSVGFVLFEKAEIALALSFAPAVFSTFYIYRISTKHFEVKSELGIIAALIFIVAPAISNHLFIELKIDFGLLFIQLAIIDLLLVLLYKQNELKFGDSQVSLLGKNFKLFILLGILSGFALTIKFTHSFLVFAVLSFFWTYYHRKSGFIAMFCLCLFGVIILGLDNLSGLKPYHLSTNYFKVILLIISLGFMVLIFKSQSKAFLNSLKITLIYSFIHIVVLSPWIIKNYTEGDKSSIVQMLRGKQNQIEMDMNILNKNYKKHLKENN